MIRYDHKNVMMVWCLVEEEREREREKYCYYVKVIIIIMKWCVGPCGGGVECDVM